MPTFDVIPAHTDHDIGWAIVRLKCDQKTGVETMEITCKGCQSTNAFIVGSKGSVFQHADDCIVLAEIKRLDKIIAQRAS